MAIFGKTTAPIYGMVGYLQFTVETDGDNEGFLYRFASERHKRLEDEIRAQVGETLGTDFEVLNVRLNVSVRPSACMVGIFAAQAAGVRSAMCRSGTLASPGRISAR